MSLDAVTAAATTTTAIANACKRHHLCVIYNIRWACNPLELRTPVRDSSIIKQLSDWLTEFTAGNADDLGQVIREWWIFHVTPGFIRIFLYIGSKDMTHRIHFPLAPLHSWSSKPLTRQGVTWTENNGINFWSFQKERARMQGIGAYSELHIRYT